MGYDRVGKQKMPRCASSDVSQSRSLRVSHTWYGRGGSPRTLLIGKAGSRGGKEVKKGKSKGSDGWMVAEAVW